MNRIQVRVGIIGCVIVLLLGATIPLLVTAQNDASETSTSPEVIEQGERLFQDLCLACHQADGVGLDGVFPALAGNPLLATDDPEYAIGRVLAGGSGMPQFSNLSNDEIVAVVSYVREELNDETSGVSADEVVAIRAELYPPNDGPATLEVPVNMPEMLQGTPQPTPAATPGATPDATPAS